MQLSLSLVNPYDNSQLLHFLLCVKQWAQGWKIPQESCLIHFSCHWTVFKPTFLIHCCNCSACLANKITAQLQELHDCTGYMVSHENNQITSQMGPYSSSLASCQLPQSFPALCRSPIRVEHVQCHQMQRNWCNLVKDNELILRWIHYIPASCFTQMLCNDHEYYSECIRFLESVSRMMFFQPFLWNINIGMDSF